MFDGDIMRTPVYIKMDAPVQLLLSEGVCRQLEIITYHSQVLVERARGSGTHEAPRVRKRRDALDQTEMEVMEVGETFNATRTETDDVI